MLHKEKDLDVAILQMHMDNTYFQKDIKNVQTNAASAQVDFQKSHSSNLIWCKTFQSDLNDLLTVETVASDPFCLSIVFGKKMHSNTNFDRNR